MARRKVPFVNNEIYHVFNRGVEKRQIFINGGDHQRFLNIMKYYLVFRKPKYSLANSSLTLHPPRGWNIEGGGKVEIIGYCLMPNHYHLLIKQLGDDGVSKFISIIQNSYTRYFNTKHERIGPLFQGTFKAVRIESDSQLLHVSRYIHLNPFVTNLAKDPKDYQWSSYGIYLGAEEEGIVTKTILSFFKTKSAYGKFVMDHADYARSLEEIKHQAIDL